MAKIPWKWLAIISALALVSTFAFLVLLPSKWENDNENQITGVG